MSGRVGWPFKARYVAVAKWGLTTGCVCNTLYDMDATLDKRLSTVGAIAELLDVATHRVTYVIASRRISPEHRAGRLRVFSDEQVEQIARELGVTIQEQKA